ncbi:MULTISPECIES: AAA family ATPase [Cysteiniphilum]|uniref:Chromosome segregation protein SMC n=1 Tax=Cysteiniphilum litorale TaxID=2056700 RepID=A0A8J3E7A8_9GAMM|nr:MULTISPECIES: AAA family ATPase [Cysteiniphilum]GGF86958.1 chromosome segregation protein SMC [Cysteiniphilum litorale]
MKSGYLTRMKVSGFKSIADLDSLELGSLNILIGANGAGKSNFIQIFRMLMSMSEGSFTSFISSRGRADNFLYNGPKITERIKISFEFQSTNNMEARNYYALELVPTVEEDFLIEESRAFQKNPFIGLEFEIDEMDSKLHSENKGWSWPSKDTWRSYGLPSRESRISELKSERSADGKYNGIGYFVHRSISNWVVYHFHDTSANSPMRRSDIVENNKKLYGNAKNIASFLLNLRDHFHDSYMEILNAIRLVMPFFDDFILDIKVSGQEQTVRLDWLQKGSDYPMQPYHLSDGSIRFICLATALLQPEPPSTIIIDEPELGLHPAAIVILAELIQQAAQRTQVIVATQSPALIDQFAVEDIIVVNRKEGASTFERLNEKDFSQWLESYSVGELWAKNVIAGGPQYE